VISELVRREKWINIQISASLSSKKLRRPLVYPSRMNNLSIFPHSSISGVATAQWYFAAISAVKPHGRCGGSYQIRVKSSITGGAAAPSKYSRIYLEFETFKI
jgi:hypothetical protein